MRTNILKLSRYRLNASEYLCFSFPFRYDYEAWAEGLGATYNPQRREWQFLLTDENVQNLNRVYGPWLEIDTSALQDYHRMQYRKQVSWNKNELKPNVTEALNNLQRSLSNSNYARKSIDLYVDYVSMLFKFHNIDLADFDLASIADFQEKVLVAKGYSNSSQRQFVSAFRHFLAFVKLPGIQASDVPFPPKSSDGPEILSNAQVKAIISKAGSLKHKTMLTLLYATGLRPCELLNLKLANLSLEKGSVQILSTHNVKTRVLLLDKDCLVLLARYLKTYQPKHYLFEGNQNMPFSASGLRKLLRQLSIQAEIFEKVSPYTFRHSFVAHCINSGLSVKHIQKLLGHQSVASWQFYRKETELELIQLPENLL